MSFAYDINGFTIPQPDINTCVDAIERAENLLTWKHKMFQVTDKIVILFNGRARYEVDMYVGHFKCNKI